VRIQPEDPGGRQAQHQGLSVNDVAAEGAASKPADRLVLAPEPLELSLEDEPVAALAAVQAEAPAEATPEAEEAETDALSDTDVAVRLAAMETLAQELSEGVEPLSDIAAAAAETAETQNVIAEPEVQETAAVVEGGLGRSLRPRLRPASVSSVEEAVAATVAAAATHEVNPDTIPPGTRMAQLGAFESPEIAEGEWDRIAGRFGEYLEDKQRVIQKAQSGGRTFYRLRAMGFADLNDARRFCSALVAEKVECIPVVTR
jgi:hypothetical protein